MASATSLLSPQFSKLIFLLTGGDRWQDRAREDFNYGFKREQQAVKDKLNDEKTALEKEIKLKRETAEKEFIQREKVLAEGERELAELRVKAAAFPKEVEIAAS